MASLANTYQQYKDDTAVFLTWLSHTAQACGYVAPASRGNESRQPSAVGKGSPSTAKPKRYTVPISEILPQAKQVAESSEPFSILPSSIGAIGRRAVSARENFATRFLDLGVDVGSDKSHVHFAQVLKSAIEILESCITPPNQSGKTTSRQGTLSSDIENLFELLEIEEPSPTSKSPSSQLNESSAIRAKLEKATKLTELRLEQESDRSDDMAIRVLCFFDDMHDTQDSLKKVWKAYKESTTDLKTAAMTTNAALCLIEKAEGDLLDSWNGDLVDIQGKPRELDASRSYDELFAFLVKSIQSRVLAKKEEVWKDLPKLFDVFSSMSSATDYMYADSYWTLWKCLSSCMLVGRPRNTVPYLGVPTLETVHRSSDDHMMTTDEFKKRAKEDRALTQLLIETLYLDQTIHAGNSVGVPSVTLMDEITKALLKIHDLNLTAHMVFAVSVMKDILNILEEDSSRASRELQKMAKDAYQSISTKNMMPYKVQGPAPGWFESDVYLISRIGLMDSFINESPIAALKIITTGCQGLTVKVSEHSQMLDSEFLQLWMDRHNDNEKKVMKDCYDKWQTHLPRQKSTHVMLSPGPLLVFERNPVYCGTLALNLTILRAQAGIALANTHLSTLFTAILYQAFRATGLLSGSWLELEKLIDQHKDELFFGSLPQDPRDIYKCFALRIGLKPSEMKVGNRRNPHMGIRVEAHGGDGAQWRSKGLNASCLSLGKYAALLRDYFEGKQTMLRSVYAMNTLMEKDNAKAIDRKARGPITIDLHLFLERFPSVADRITEACSIDYLDLTRRCYALQNALLVSKIIYPKTAYAKSMAQFEDLHILEQILQDSSTREAMADSSKILGKIDYGESDLEIAAKFVQKYLDKQGWLAK
ncbi:MAG: hypothetical protein M1820_005406 [Bogoriella megaspora]|nr:MAG: hypothetical protein M1820_005406 [Bogoriella megaspora]